MKRLVPTFALAVLSLAPEPVSAAQENLFSVDLGLSILTIVVFLIVLGVLGKFAWGPIMAGLEARESGIQGSIDEAAKMRAEAQLLLEEHRKQIAASRREAQEIVAAGREAGEKVRQEIESKAREESDRMLDRARKEIERERDQAIESLRKESVELALSAASRLLQEKLDTEADRRLVEGYLGGLDRKAAKA
jgi:F-type H+-transporting ATPase subunit b